MSLLKLPRNKTIRDLVPPPNTNKHDVMKVMKHCGRDAIKFPSHVAQRERKWIGNTLRREGNKASSAQDWNPQSQRKERSPIDNLETFPRRRYKDHQDDVEGKSDIYIAPINCSHAQSVSQLLPQSVAKTYHIIGRHISLQGDFTICI